MYNYNRTQYQLYSLMLIIFLSACQTDDLDIDLSSDEIDYADWDESTHGKDAYLDYDVVFNQNEVLRFDIEINNDNWEMMKSDLDQNLESSNRPGQSLVSDFDPIWVPCDVHFNETEWYHVGIRYKGNSSLQSAYQSGIEKLSFKLDFDEFEDNFSQIDNQRFYGFKQLNLNNNSFDYSLMREKVGADLFRQFGLAASKTAFCVVYIDHGDGPQYFGVYTLVEEVDDTVIETQFDDDDGNLYKPDGDAASFAEGSYDTDEFYLKTNEDVADYSDVKELYDIINSSDRNSDVEFWKENLESVFDVNEFLKYLAANTVIQNWDTYGIMTHNYFLYNNPQNDLLTWIPWDNNEAFQTGKNGGALSLSMNEVNSNWPLISYIIDQKEYKDKYHAYLQLFVDEVFEPYVMIDTYSAYYELIKEYAYEEESGFTFLSNESQFDSAVETLKSHVQSRNNAVEAYLN